MPDPPFDLAEPIHEICRRLELEPRNVCEIVLRPREATISVYRLRKGEKYLKADGEPAIRQWTIPIRT